MVSCLQSKWHWYHFVLRYNIFLSPFLAVWHHFLFASYLVHRPIKEAFDAGFLCFILGKDGEHRVHLLDARLYNVKLTDTKAYPWLKPPGQERMAKGSKQQDIMKDVMEWVLCCQRSSLRAAFWRHFSVLKLAGVLAERWRRLLVTFQPLQPYKANSFSLKGMSALLNAAWPSKPVKAGIQLCPKAASAHQLYQR